MIDALEKDFEFLRPLIKRPTVQKLLEQYYQLNDEKIQQFREQNNVYMKYEGFQILRNEYPEEIKKLEHRREELERQNVDLYRELEETKAQLALAQKELRASKQRNTLLEEEATKFEEKLASMDRAADQQARAIADLQRSHEDMMRELEKVTVERNLMQEMMLTEKMKISEQLNELNELNESLMRQKKVIEQDQERFNKQYKDMQSTGKFVQLAPQASDAQLLARNTLMDDIPQMVVRRLNKYHQVEIYDIAQNLNGSLVATCGGDRYLRLYDPFNLNMISQMQIPSDEVFTTLEFSPQQDSILVGSTSNSCQLYQISGWKLRCRMTGHGDQVTCVSFLGGDKDSCVSGSKDRNLKLWNIHNSFCTRSISTGSQILSLASQHNVPIVVTGHRDGSIRGYSLKSDPKPLFHEKNLFDDSVTSLCISNDNNELLCCSKEGYYIRAYDLRMNKVLRTYQHDKYMNSYDHNKICYGPDEKFIVAGNSDGTLVSWKSDGKFYKQLSKGQHEGVVLCVSFHPVSGQMYSADTRGNLVVWK